MLFCIFMTIFKYNLIYINGKSYHICEDSKEVNALNGLFAEHGQTL